MGVGDDGGLSLGAELRILVEVDAFGKENGVEGDCGCGVSVVGAAEGVEEVLTKDLILGGD